MKRKGIKLLGAAAIVILLGAAAFLFFGRQEARFDGDRIRTSDPERFFLRFEAMNMADTEVMPLREGDRLRVSWQLERGSVDLMIFMAGEKTLYQANSRGSGDEADFEVTIPQSGDYAISVSGRQARGWMEFSQVRRDDDPAGNETF